MNIKDFDFVSSEYCTECGGEGYLVVNAREGEIDQCESCEELHRQELIADRMQDQAKGN